MLLLATSYYLLLTTRLLDRGPQRVDAECEAWWPLVGLGPRTQCLVLGQLSKARQGKVRPARVSS